MPRPAPLTLAHPWLHALHSPPLRQGAGGNCNVVKEIIYPLGAQIDVRAIRLGDATMSVLEIWGAEYQENDALLIKAEARATLEAVCARERCIMQVRGAAPCCSAVVGPCRPAAPLRHRLARSKPVLCLPACRPPRFPPMAQVIGTIDGSGRVVLVDREAPPGSPTPVDLDLDKVLGDMPNKTFK